MPFTFAHPAIVLPLTYLPKRWYSLTGLIAGSLTPDFEYFIRMKVTSIYSHTIDSLFWFDLPVGIVLAFLFHNIVRDTLFDNLHATLRLRFQIFKQCKWNNHFRRNWIVVILSILLGAASHVLWDSFTHEHGYFVQSIPILTATVELASLQVPVFKFLQHGSTVIGLIIIILTIFQLKVTQSENTSINIKYWIILLLSCCIVVGLKMASGLKLTQYGAVVVTIISAGIISFIIAPIVMRYLDFFKNTDSSNTT
jgi:hypothetical protein